jgi:hypothetical protein
MITDLQRRARLPHAVIDLAAYEASHHVSMQRHAAIPHRVSQRMAVGLAMVAAAVWSTDAVLLLLPRLG